MTLERGTLAPSIHLTSVCYFYLSKLCCVNLVFLVIARVQAFLPQIEASNVEVLRQAKADPTSVDIENVGDKAQHIEMVVISRTWPNNFLDLILILRRILDWASLRIEAKRLDQTMTLLRMKTQAYHPIHPALLRWNQSLNRTLIRMRQKITMWKS